MTAWKVVDAAGRIARCVLSDRGHGWRLVLWRDASIVLWEAHATARAAIGRAGELWSVLVKNGWRSTDEPASGPTVLRDYYRRGCPECRAQAAVVTYRRHGYVVLFCEECEHGWTDRERSPQTSRDPSTLLHRDRRRIA